MGFLYGFAFPSILFAVTAVKIGLEWSQSVWRHPSFGLLFNTLIFILLAVSLILYLFALHRKL
jgi:hypothetical protein